MTQSASQDAVIVTETPDDESLEAQSFVSAGESTLYQAT